MNPEGSPLNESRENFQLLKQKCESSLNFAFRQKMEELSHEDLVNADSPLLKPFTKMGQLEDVLKPIIEKLNSARNAEDIDEIYKLIERIDEI
ncbi:MAG: hypothetical protein A3D44_02455 [Candidatus Staskawiczbacteria bacterium RIFCSPHIGHO2_02_FULL_42_22]|uniref:Uncharacterized protein n=1 Tax=Candidatus Staskawiczbacteria bacterium RIFCSPHIGHO2_02_FULL_42_22 TaxID=1802207 RepID=A0A1G2HZG3_9BACT|nr:MAG: hypothetical protein A3D44_02455 [Candidatus Staskawiczbacteria bacterium RIFCSPHIGHO2_02_FULL_42_22]